MQKRRNKMKEKYQEIIKSYREFLIEDEKSPATIDRYIRDINLFFIWLADKNIDKATLLDYKSKLQRQYAISSVNSKLSSLNNYLEWAGMPNLRLKTFKIQKQTFYSTDKELTKKEYIKLLDAAQASNNMQLCYIMQTICSTGIRVSELKFITVECLKKRKVKINLKSKIRQIFLPDDLCELLLEYSAGKGIKKGVVFITKNGKPIDRSNIWKSMKKLCNKAGVSPEKIFPHNLRHLFARTFYSIQKDIVRLSDLLGHTSINTTRIYTIENGDMHRKQIQSLKLIYPIHLQNIRKIGRTT